MNELTDAVVDFTIKHTNVSSTVKMFVNNTNIAVKKGDKIVDLVTMNLCIANDKDILTDVFEIIKIVL